MYSRTTIRARTVALTCLAAGLIGAVAVYLLFVQTAAGQRLDTRLAPDSGAVRSSWLLAAYDRHVVAAELGVLIVVIVIGAVRHRWWRGLASAAMPLVVAVLVDATQARLSRPVFTLDGSSHNSFPSGHVALAAATVIAVVLVLPDPVRTIAGVLGAAAVALIMLATIAAGWHRFSDGLGSVLIAIAAGGAVVLAAPIRPPDGVGRAGSAAPKGEIDASAATASAVWPASRQYPE